MGSFAPTDVDKCSCKSTNGRPASPTATPRTVRYEPRTYGLFSRGAAPVGSPGRKPWVNAQYEPKPRRGDSANDAPPRVTVTSKHRSQRAPNGSERALRGSTAPLHPEPHAQLLALSSSIPERLSLSHLARAAYNGSASLIIDAKRTRSSARRELTCTHGTS